MTEAVRAFGFKQAAPALFLQPRKVIRMGLPPVRLEILKAGTLYVAVQYIQYISGLPFEPSLFRRPKGIQFEGEGTSGK